jgi:hypothetical protein
MNAVVNQASLVDFSYGSDDAKTDASAAGKKAKPEDRLPRFKGFTITNVISRHSGSAGLIFGLEDAPVENVTVKDCVLSAKTGFLIREALGIRFENVRILADKGAAFIIDNASKVDIVSPTFRAGADVLVEVRGSRTAAIAIESPAEKVKVASDVRTGEVTVKAR